MEKTKKFNNKHANLRKYQIILEDEVIKFGKRGIFYLMIGEIRMCITVKEFSEKSIVYEIYGIKKIFSDKTLVGFKSQIKMKLQEVDIQPALAVTC